MSEIDVEAVRLRQFREARGLTQQEVTDQLARLAWVRNGERVGVNADMVSKWERGLKRPSKLYRDLLALLYEAPPDRLGIVPARPHSTITGPPAQVDAALSEALVGATAILDELGPAGVLLQPKVFEIWKEDVMKRRTVLKLFGIAPAVLAFGKPGRASGTAQPAADVLEDLAAKYQRLYHSAKPAHLMTPVLAHLSTVAEVIRDRAAGTVERRALLRNESHVGMLAGRIAFFDLHDPISARGYYNLAYEAAREANDALLAAAALGHIAFIPAAEHRYTAATDYLDGADRQLSRNPHPLVVSWLAAVQAEIQANAGNERGALEALESADRALAADAPAPPGWFDFFDASRLAGFKGYAHLRAKRFTDASAALRAASAGLPAHAYKQRAVILTDAATVHLHAGEVEDACRTAGQAVDLLHLADYATGTDRLREFRGQLAPWKNHPMVRDLDDQLTTL